MAKIITSKFAGDCADQACGHRLPAGSRVRWYGRGRIYCVQHPDGKGSRSVPAKGRTGLAGLGSVLSPALMANVEAALRNGTLGGATEEDAAMLRAIKDGQERAAEDTVKASVQEELDFDGETELDRSLAHGDEVAQDPRNQ